jgi:hypothetical protein
LFCFARKQRPRGDQGAISSTFLEQLFRLQILKVQKKTVKLSVFFTLLGSAHEKAACVHKAFTLEDPQSAKRLSMSFCANGIFTRKSCSENVGEIDPKEKKAFPEKKGQKLINMKMVERKNLIGSR